MVRAVPGLTLPATFNGLSGNASGRSGPVPAGVVTCAPLAAVPAMRRCPAGAAAAAFPAAAFGVNGVLGLDADVRLTSGHDLGSVWFKTHAA